MKHIDIILHFVRDIIESIEVRIKKIVLKENPAYVFTEFLSRWRFIWLIFWLKKTEVGVEVVLWFGVNIAFLFKCIYMVWWVHYRLLKACLWALEFSSMCGECSIARAQILVPRSSWWHAVAPLTATIARPYAHFVPLSLPTPVFALPIAVCTI